MDWLMVLTNHIYFSRFREELWRLVFSLCKLAYHYWFMTTWYIYVGFISIDAFKLSNKKLFTLKFADLFGYDYRILREFGICSDVFNIICYMFAFFGYFENCLYFIFIYLSVCLFL